MEQHDYDIFEKMISFRVFEEEMDQMRAVIRGAMDSEGFRKYHNISHFCRCAVIKLLRDETPKIKTKPKKSMIQRISEDGR